MTVCMRSHSHRVMVVLGMLLVALGLQAAASATLGAQAAVPASPLPLAFTAVGQPSGYFDAVMPAGISRTFQVGVTNSGASDFTARTYKADVFTLANGGFGAKTGADPTTGASEWFAYPQQTPTIAAGKELVISFTVKVPAKATAGRYVSSVILENIPNAAGSTLPGSSQLVRSALAVSVRVPGPLLPALTIEAVDPRLDGNQTTFVAALSNTGNDLIKPAVAFKLVNSAGVTVWSTTTSMGSFYAKTSATATAGSVAVTAGTYTLTVTASDTVAGLAPVAVTRKFSLSGATATATTKPVAPLPVGAPRWGVNVLQLVALGVVLAVIVIAIRKRGRVFSRFAAVGEKS